MNKNNKKKEFARDFLALGSWVFFVLVIVRAAIEPYRPFIDQLIIAGVLLVVVGLVFRRKKFYDPYVARGLVLVVFTTIFYNSRIFSIFVILIMIGLIISSYVVGNKWKKINLGLIIGAIVSIISWYVTGLY